MRANPIAASDLLGIAESSVRTLPGQTRRKFSVEAQFEKLKHRSTEDTEDHRGHRSEVLKTRADTSKAATIRTSPSSACWNLIREPSRQPRILFLADRNILAKQAYNAFSAFPEGALVRIAPDEIPRRGREPTNGSLFQEKLTPVLRLKYHNSIADAVADLGRPEELGKVFAGFQRCLYESVA